jgi:hypothetical protein
LILYNYSLKLIEINPVPVGWGLFFSGATQMLLNKRDFVRSKINSNFGGSKILSNEPIKNEIRE